VGMPGRWRNSRRSWCWRGNAGSLDCVRLAPHFARDDSVNLRRRGRQKMSVDCGLDCGVSTALRAGLRKARNVKYPAYSVDSPSLFVKKRSLRSIETKIRLCFVWSGSFRDAFFPLLTSLVLPFRRFGSDCCSHYERISRLAGADLVQGFWVCPTG